MKRKFWLILVLMIINIQICFGSIVTIIERDISYSFTKTPGNVVKLETITEDIQGWNVNSGGIVLDENDSFVMPDNDVEIEALYEAASEALLTVNIYGQYTEEMKAIGSTVTVTAPVDPGFSFQSWQASGIELTAIQEVSQSITFTMPSNPVRLVTVYQTLGEETTYTVSYNANGGDGAPTSQTKTHGVNLTLAADIPSRTGFDFVRWSTGADGTGRRYNPGGVYSSDEDVTLYAVWTKPLSSVAVGAYISYTPSSTSYTVSTSESGYTSSQTFNPSQVTSWRVFENNSGQLDIISNESAASLYLKGRDGYRKAVNTLNNLSSAYVNPIYATSGRSLGGNSSSVGAMTQNLTNSVSAGSLPFSDTYYSHDKGIIDSNPTLSHSSGYVWLASRKATSGTSGVFYRVRCLDSSRALYDTSNFMYGAYSSGSGEGFAITNGVRPIISLKSSIWITGGDGTEGNPYTISEDSAYTISYDANGGGNEPEAQIKGLGIPLTLSNTAPTRSGYVFLGWATSNSAAVAEYQPGDTFEINEDITLYAVWRAATIQNIPIGAYIAYTPSTTSYTVLAASSGYTNDQSYTPNTYAQGWKVFSNNDGEVEIVSAESVGNLHLGTTSGYKKGVKTLNDLSSAYVNPTYASGGRSLGSNATSQGEITQSLVFGVNGFPYEDTTHTTDVNIITANPGLIHSSGTVWLASRYQTTGVEIEWFYLRKIDASSVVGTEKMCYKHTNGTLGEASYGATYGVRPVVTLKPGIRITGGSGTQADPYTIDLATTYTVSYDANGGSGAPEAQTKTQGVALVLSSTVPTKDGYNFLGWSTSSTATTAEYVAGGSFTTDADTTLYAVYGEVPPAVKWVWNPTNEVTGGVSQLTKGVRIKARSPTQISWGDNTTTDVTASVVYALYTHTYSTAGSYTVTVKDDVVRELNLLRTITSNSFSDGGQVYNNQISELDVGNNTVLRVLECHSNNLSELDVSNNTALEVLRCYNNNLSELDVRNTALEVLDCHSNNLSELDVSDNTALTNLSCYDNNLSELNVRNNTALTSLQFHRNNLSELDVSNNTALTTLRCYSNNLSELDVSNNTALTTLICYSNNLSELDLTGNTNISRVCCVQPSMTSLILTAEQMTRFNIINETGGCGGTTNEIHKHANTIVSSGL